MNEIKQLTSSCLPAELLQLSMRVLSAYTNWETYRLKSLPFALILD